MIQVEIQPRRVPEDLVGRAEEFALAGHHIDNGTPIVNLWGPAGVGKTKLATSLAAHCERHVFRVDLISLTTREGIVESVARALQIESTSADLEVRINEVARSLRARGAALLFLDNAEHVVEEVAELVTSWRDGPPILVTSRRSLNVPDEVCVPVRTLDVRNATALLERRALEVRPGLDLDRTTAEALVESLDRLPLAIELAAKRLAIMNPEQLLARMHERFALLSSPDHSSRLEASIELSWQLLDEHAREALSALSTLRSPFDLDLALAVVNREALDALVESSLVVEYGDDKFGLLVSVHDFARSRAPQDVLSQARAAAEAFLLETSEHHESLLRTPDEVQAFDWLESHRSHILDAAALALDDDRHDEAARLALAVRAVEFRIGRFVELNRILHAVQPTMAELQCRVELANCFVELRIGDVAEVLRRIDELEPDLTGDLRYRAGQLRTWALTRMFRIDESHAELESLVARAQGEGDDRWEAELSLSLLPLRTNMCLYGFLPADRLPANHDDNVRLLERVRTLFGPFRQLAAIRGLAASYKAMGELESARLTEEAALALPIPPGGWQITARLGLSKVERNLGNHSAAMEHAEEALRIARLHGIRNLEIPSMLEAGERAWYAGELDRALEHHRQALAEATELNHLNHLLHIQIGLARVLVDLGEFEEAGRLVKVVRERDDIPALSNGELSVLEVILAAESGDGEADISHALSILRQTPTYGSLPTEWDELWHAAIDLFSVEADLAAGQIRRAQEKLGTAERLAHEAPERHEQDCYWIAPLRLVSNTTERIRMRFDIPDEPASGSLRVANDGAWYELDGTRQDLSSRKPLANVLAALARAPDGIDTEGLIAAGWPGETIEGNAGRNRLYATIRMLRKAGLDGVILSSSGRYSIDRSVFVDIVD